MFRPAQGRKLSCPGKILPAEGILYTFPGVKWGVKLSHLGPYSGVSTPSGSAGRWEMAMEILEYSWTQQMQMGSLAVSSRAE